MSFERPHISLLDGYVPGEQPDESSVIKLNTNENPYPPSPLVTEALKAFDPSRLRRYPPPTASSFRQQAAKIHGVQPDNIIPTNGGDELLRLTMTTFVGNDDVIAVMKPSYSLYPVLAGIQNSKLVEIPLNDAWGMPENFAQQLNAAKVKLAILVNPHAPTGSLLTVSYLQQLATDFNGVLLIDEAYVDFIDPAKSYDALPLINEHANVLFLRTLSKGYSLAGLRFGYGVGPQSLISPMMYKTRDSYNTDFISQVLATAALESRDYAADNWRRVRQSRQSLAGELAQLQINCLPSQANFLLGEIPSVIGAFELQQKLKDQHILVRHFDQDRLRNKLRISIGTQSENRALIDALKRII